MELEAFYFQPCSFLIPVEHLTPAGIEATFAAVIRERCGLSAGWIERFEAAFSSAHARTKDLFARSPGAWFPARLQNVCVVTAPERTHAFMLPLSKSAWVLYASDFESETSSPELATYLFLQAERLSIVEAVGAALVANLSYWLVRSDAEVEDFVAGCARSTRPSAVIQRTLADSLPWVRTLYHRDLKPVTLTLSAPLSEMSGTGLLVPAHEDQKITDIALAGEAGAREGVHDHYHAQAARCTPNAPFLEWLSSTAPRLVITGEGGRTLWDPNEPGDVDALRAILADAPVPASSLQADLQLISDRTSRYLGALRDPDSLPFPTEEIDQADGTYLHIERRLIAFDLLHQPSWIPLREETPPYQRLLLAARVVHEWGHLCEESRIIRVAPENEAEHAAATAELQENFTRFIGGLPGPLQQLTREELDGKTGAEAGALATERALHRMPDYLANVIAKRYLEPEELEAYIRVNVRTHREERLTPLRLLTNYVVEYQYLRLSPITDPLAYFLKLTAFEQLFFANGLITPADLEALFANTARVCDSHTVDEDAFHPS